MWLPYVHAFVFAVLVSPIHLVMGWITGLFFSAWERLSHDLATGMLFAYAAVLSAEVVLRLDLLPAVIKKSREELCGILRHLGFAVLLFSLLGLSFLWAANRPFSEISPIAHGIAIFFSILALALVFVGVRIESEGKHGIDLFTRKPTTSRARRAA